MLYVENGLYFLCVNGFKTLIPYGVSALTLILCNVKSVTRCLVKCDSFGFSHIHTKKDICDFVAVAYRSVMSIAGEFVNTVARVVSCGGYG